MTTTTTLHPYQMLTVEMGVLFKQSVDVMLIPRDEFMDLIDRVEEWVLDNHEGVPEAEGKLAEVRSIAKRMDRFPFGNWMTPRGCGCVIGEYLVARDVLDRAVDTGSPDVQVLLEEDCGPSLAAALVEYGVEIDRVVGHLAAKYTPPTAPSFASAVVIVDDFTQPLPFKILEVLA